MDAPYISPESTRTEAEGLALRLCRDCRWCRNTDGGWRYATCTAPDNTAVDPVSGNTTRIYTYARTCREPGSVCGQEARWFEPKPEAN